jgi:beta-lactamase class A
MKVLYVPALTIYLLLTGCASIKNATPSMELNKSKTFPRTDVFINNLLKQHPEYFDSLLRNNDKWRISIIYTQVDRSAGNKPKFTNYYFNVDPKQYFYPASTVKMPTAFLALEKINQMNIAGLDKNTTMITDAAYDGQTAVYNDPTSADGRPSIAHYIKKIFLVSDNDAFNRLYEFLGQEHINSRLHQLGYESAQILHRLQVSMREDQHRRTNPVTFYDSSGRVIYKKPLETSFMKYQERHTLLGSGYYQDDKLINQPFDFSRKNRITLADLHSILQAVIFPGAVPVKQRFQLSDSDYRFIYKYMSMKPRESRYPPYDSSFNGAYSKFVLYGGKGDMADGVRIFNKEGDAYGFLNDVAYVVDFNKGIEFFLSATILCNSDGIFNDDHYDYETIGFPFFRRLGEVIYQYERERKRKHVPDLAKFKIDYSD